ncbi:MAG: helix-turn-helix transcriptional regulator [Methyloligellaceae bacterium]
MRTKNGYLIIELPALWTTKQLAEYLQLSPTTLVDYRKKKIGPKYLKFKSGAIRYNTKDVSDWLVYGIEMGGA